MLLANRDTEFNGYISNCSSWRLKSAKPERNLLIDQYFTSSNLMAKIILLLKNNSAVNSHPNFNNYGLGGIKCPFPTYITIQQIIYHM